LVDVLISGSATRLDARVVAAGGGAEDEERQEASAELHGPSGVRLLESMSKSRTSALGRRVVWGFEGRHATSSSGGQSGCATCLDNLSNLDILSTDATTQATCDHWWARRSAATWFAEPRRSREGGPRHGQSTLRPDQRSAPRTRGTLMWRRQAPL